MQKSVVGELQSYLVGGAITILKNHGVRQWEGLFPIYGDGSKPCTPVVHIKIAGKWMFIPLKMVLIGIDPYPYGTIKAMFQTTNQLLLFHPPHHGQLNHPMEFLMSCERGHGL